MRNNPHRQMERWIIAAIERPSVDAAEPRLLPGFDLGEDVFRSVINVSALGTPLAPRTAMPLLLPGSREPFRTAIAAASPTRRASRYLARSTMRLHVWATIAHFFLKLSVGSRRQVDGSSADVRVGAAERRHGSAGMGAALRCSRLVPEGTRGCA